MTQDSSAALPFGNIFPSRSWGGWIVEQRRDGWGLPSLSSPRPGALRDLSLPIRRREKPPYFANRLKKLVSFQRGRAGSSATAAISVAMNALNFAASAFSTGCDRSSASAW